MNFGLVFAGSKTSEPRTTMWEEGSPVVELDDLFARLERSTFRRRFRLGRVERDYLTNKGLEVILAHGADFIESRLAPAFPKNDGKQTPMRNHPIFVAQHATATCCRGCLEKWHHIPKGRELSVEEKDHILSVHKRWLLAQIQE